MVVSNRPRFLSKKNIKNLHGFFRNMPIKIFAILIVLTICMSSIIYFEFFNKNRLNSPTKIIGFKPFSLIYNNEGIVTSSEEEILIEATSMTQPQVMVYSSSSNFKWNFSVTALTATNDSIPAAFFLDWQLGNFSVWTSVEHGWFYNYYGIDQNDCTDIYLDSSLKLNSQYTLEIVWTKQLNNVDLRFTLSNATWNNQIIYQFKLPSNTPIDYATLVIGALTNQTSNSIALFNHSHFVSYNSENFTQKTLSSSMIFLISSILISIIVLLVTAEKFSQFPTIIREFFRKLKTFISSINTKNFPNRFFLFIKSNRTVILIFIFFAGVRLVLTAITSGHQYDLYTYAIWMDIAKNDGVAAVYSFSEVLPPYILDLRPSYPYPPIIAYILSLIPRLPGYENLTLVLIRLPAIIADLFLGLVVFMSLKSKKDFSVAVIALFLSLLNFFVSSLWGQYDSIVALFIVLAVWLIATKKIELGWVFIALAICTKQTALIFLPGLLILSIKQKSWSRLIYGFLTFIAVTFFIWYPLLLSGFSVDFALQTTGLGLLSSGSGLDPISPIGGGGTSIWAFNIWPLITSAIPFLTSGNTPILLHGIIGGVRDSTQLFMVSYFQLGTLLFLSFYLYIAIKIWKEEDPLDIILSFGLLSLGFFMLPTRVHERYLLFALSFIPFIYYKSKIIFGSYLVLLITHGLNILYALTSGIHGQDMISGPLSFFNAIFSPWGLLTIISINLMVFLILVINTFGIKFRKIFRFKKVKDE